MATYTVTIESAKGRRITGVPAALGGVSKNELLIHDGSVPLETGDRIRLLRRNKEEVFEVLEPNLVVIGHGVAPYYRPTIKHLSTGAVSEKSAADPRRVFVVHGRDLAARKAMVEFLKALGLRPIEWTDAVRLTGKASPFIAEVIEAGFEAARAVVVLLTGDDVARLRSELLSDVDPPTERELTPQARPNVLFEAGYAFARHPNRTVLVELGKLRPFSDVQGRYVIRLDNTVDRRRELGDRLKDAGCKVTFTRYPWAGAGDFEQK